MPTALEGQQMTVRPATPNEVTLILSFIQKKAEFDRHIGSFFALGMALRGKPNRDGILVVPA